MAGEVLGGLQVPPATLGARLRADAAALMVAVPDLGHAEALRGLFALVERCLRLSAAARVVAEREAAQRYDLAEYEAGLARLCAGEPIAYVLGEQPFRGRSYRVSADVLVPRPDTETLVEAALERLESTGAPEVLDLGTGSGCVAIEIALDRPAATVTGVDLCGEALAVACGNARRLGAGNIRWQRSDWYAALGGCRFHLIVSNPPYVAEGDPHLPALAREPRGALVSGPDGLADLRRIVAGAPAHLRSGGWLCVEHGFEQGDAVRTLFLAQGLAEVRTFRDAGGRDRVCAGRWISPGADTTPALP